LACFVGEIESEETSEAGALIPASADLLWPMEILKVFFLNPPIRISFDDDFINKEQIISWMNEWSPQETSSVPKFKRTKNCDESDIRVDFTG
jgi:hypothetical protein